MYVFSCIKMQTKRLNLALKGLKFQKLHKCLFCMVKLWMTFIKKIIIKCVDTWQEIDQLFRVHTVTFRRKRFVPFAKRLRLLAQLGCPSFVMEPFCHLAKRSARPRTNCGSMLVCAHARTSAQPCCLTTLVVLYLKDMIHYYQVIKRRIKCFYCKYVTLLDKLQCIAVMACVSKWLQNYT